MRGGQCGLRATHRLAQIHIRRCQSTCWVCSTTQAALVKWFRKPKYCSKRVALTSAIYLPRQFQDNSNFQLTLFRTKNLFPSHPSLLVLTWYILIILSVRSMQWFPILESKSSLSTIKLGYTSWINKLNQQVENTLLFCVMLRGHGYSKGSEEYCSPIKDHGHPTGHPT